MCPPLGLIRGSAALLPEEAARDVCKAILIRKPVSKNLGKLAETSFQISINLGILRGPTGRIAMTQFILHISNYNGLVPGTWHFRGRVEGPHPQSCHGGSRYNAPEARGKTVCEEGHELPEQVKWDVEAEWTEERRDRWAAGNFEGPSPQQFDTEEAVLDRAMIQFLDGSGGLCEEGDELWYGWINPFNDLTDASDGWGMMIARKCTS
jgi:hypothetical protein